MQFVFVHGVSAPRDIEEYKKIADERDENFRKMCFESVDITFYNPFWGDNGVPSKDEYKTIPKDKNTGHPDLLTRTPISLEGQGLIEVARDDYEAFLNSLAISAMENTADPKSFDLSLNIASYALAQESSQSEKFPAWLIDGSVTTDAQMLERLAGEVNAVSDGVRGLTTTDSNHLLEITGQNMAALALPSIADLLRRHMSPNLAVFVGDAFMYLSRGDGHDLTRGRVKASLIQAAKTAKVNDEKLVLCGHSMGANILFDMLTNKASVDDIEADLDFPLEIDLFLTVGCQFGLLQEMKLFNFMDGKQEITKPDNIAFWWHVFNYADVLSFTLDGLVDETSGIDVFSSNTTNRVDKAHGDYFVSSLFFKRLRKRMKTAGLI